MRTSIVYWVSESEPLKVHGAPCISSSSDKKRAPDRFMTLYVCLVNTFDLFVCPELDGHLVFSISEK